MAEEVDCMGGHGGGEHSGGRRREDGRHPRPRVAMRESEPVEGDDAYDWSEC